MQEQECDAEEGVHGAHHTAAQKEDMDRKKITHFFYKLTEPIHRDALFFQKASVIVEYNL